MILGDFETDFNRSWDGLEGTQKITVIFENILVTLYFIGTTFFTQIAILNMLIAIMALVFEKHHAGLNELGKR